MGESTLMPTSSKASSTYQSISSGPPRRRRRLERLLRGVRARVVLPEDVDSPAVHVGDGLAVDLDVLRVHLVDPAVGEGVERVRDGLRVDLVLLLLRRPLEVVQSTSVRVGVP